MVYRIELLDAILGRYMRGAAGVVSVPGRHSASSVVRALCEEGSEMWVCVEKSLRLKVASLALAVVLRLTSRDGATKALMSLSR